MQKSGQHLNLMGDAAISPGKGERNLGVGRPEAEWSLSQVHLSQTCSFNWVLKGASKDTQGLLAFPPVCLLMYSWNWILTPR